MIKEWLHRLLGERYSAVDQSQTSEDIFEMLDFFWSQISMPKNVVSLSKQSKDYKKLNAKEKIDKLPWIYLHLENHLVNQKNSAWPSKRLVREYIKKKFHLLLEYENFKLIFLREDLQEIALCRNLLKSVLDRSSEIFGNFHDPFLIEAQETLGDKDLFKKKHGTKYGKKKLLDHSKQIFDKLKESLGEQVVVSIYHTVYKAYFENYYLLDTFSATLHIVPQGILEQKQAYLPSKEQMHKMLMQKVNSLEEKNAALLKEMKQRQRMERALKDSEELKTIVLETAMDGVILVNEEGTILNWNHKAEEILGWSKKEAIGNVIYELLPTSLGTNLGNGLNEYIEHGKELIVNKRVEVPITNRYGKHIDIELSISPIITQNGYIFNAFIRDITNRKLIDKEIREAKEIAEKSAEAKSVFLSNMSHEIRTPLNVILGLSKILQKNKLEDSPTNVKNLEGIIYASENLLNLVNDILDFSKIESGKLALQTADFNLHTMIDDVSRGFALKAKEQGVTLTTNIAKDVPKFIRGDQFRLNQILSNLLSNAVKFTDDGSIDIQISVKEKDAENIVLNFTVSDTGIGIAQDKLDEIFNSFYQVFEPGKNKAEGTGIGLSIVKSLVALQGGQLSAKSVLKTGSTFSFDIPYKISKQLKVVQKPRRDSEGALKGLKILVVEDNRLNQIFISQLLNNWGTLVTIAEDGKAALKKLNEAHYDLVIMDLHMPVMDGFEATAQIRRSESPSKQQIPIIACSADAFPKSRQLAKEAGVNFYITKPVVENELKDILLGIQAGEFNVHTSTPKLVTAQTDHGKSYETESLLNLARLKRTFGDDKSFIKSLLEIFLEDTPRDYSLFVELIEAHKYEKASEMAHKLKSSFESLGIEKPSSLLNQIEKDIRSSADTDSIDTLLSELNILYPKVISEVNNKISEF